jgi:hypothetical protein
VFAIVYPVGVWGVAASGRGRRGSRNRVVESIALARIVGAFLRGLCRTAFESLFPLPVFSDLGVLVFIKPGLPLLHQLGVHRLAFTGHARKSGRI